MQTAVEWLIEELKKVHHSTEAMIMYAKKLEREQHGKTWDSAIEQGEKRAWNISRLYTDFDDYFAETYGSKGSETLFLEGYEQINQDNPITKGSTALVRVKSSQTEISDAGKDTADYIDRHIIESMKELAREGFKPQVSEISDKDIEKQAFKFAQEESYGEFSGDLWKGYVFGAKRMRDQLKQL